MHGVVLLGLRGRGSVWTPVAILQSVRSSSSLGLFKRSHLLLRDGIPDLLLQCLISVVGVVFSVPFVDFLSSGG